MRRRKRHGRRRAGRGTTSRRALILLFQFKYAKPGRSWKATRLTKYADEMFALEPVQSVELRAALQLFVQLDPFTGRPPR